MSDATDRSLLEHYGPQRSYLHCSAVVWPAAEALCAYTPAQIAQGATVVELGAGTGWFGLSLACARPDLRICLTETIESGAFDRLKANMTDAESRLPPGVTVPRVATLDWRDFLSRLDQLPIISYCCKHEDESKSLNSDSHPSCGGESLLYSSDWIVGSDLVYSDDGAAALCAVLAQALTRRCTCPRPRCVIAHTCERFGSASYDASLLRELRQQGLYATPVAGDIETDPSAATQQRVVVFEISCDNNGSNKSTRGIQRGDALGEAVLMRSRRAWTAYLEALSESEREEIELGQAMAGLLHHV